MKMKLRDNLEAAISHELHERTSNTKDRFFAQWIAYLILFTALLALAIPEDDARTATLLMN
jgi:hypothetical protein